MLYIPMFKLRRYEIQTIDRTRDLFCDNIIPLIEILQEHYGKTEFEVDPITGEFVKEKHKSREQRKRKAACDDDIDTLCFINQHLDRRKAFIDYFRFSPETYKRNFEAAKVSLSLRLNQDEQLYLDHLINISKNENLIPVLSIKKNYYPQGYRLPDFIQQIQSTNREIAIRLDENAFGAFAATISKRLRDTDYIMYDIGEQKISSKIVELTEFNKLNTAGRKIVLNSPRIRETLNDAYENRNFTPLIDNSARDISLLHTNITGFGDYCGLKDSLSMKGGPYGRALALLYLYGKNQFMAYMNPDSEEGQLGFSKLVPQIVADRSLLDKTGTCPVVTEIAQMNTNGSYGGWGTWIRLICTRYLYQMHMHINV